MTSSVPLSYTVYANCKGWRTSLHESIIWDLTTLANDWPIREVREPLVSIGKESRKSHSVGPSSISALCLICYQALGSLVCWFSQTPAAVSSLMLNMPAVPVSSVSSCWQVGWESLATCSMMGEKFIQVIGQQMACSVICMICVFVCFVSVDLPSKPVHAALESLVIKVFCTLSLYWHLAL